jgi:hypothetical protein
VYNIISYIIKIYNNIILNKYVFDVNVIWSTAQFYVAHGSLVGCGLWVGGTADEKYIIIYPRLTLMIPVLLLLFKKL